MTHYLTVSEVAERLNVSDSFVRKLIRNGALAASRFNTNVSRGPIRIAVEEFKRYLEQSQGAEPTPRRYNFMR